MSSCMDSLNDCEFSVTNLWNVFEPFPPSELFSVGVEVYSGFCCRYEYATCSSRPSCQSSCIQFIPLEVLKSRCRLKKKFRNFSCRRHVSVFTTRRPVNEEKTREKRYQIWRIRSNWRLPFSLNT